MASSASEMRYENRSIHKHMFTSANRCLKAYIKNICRNKRSGNCLGDASGDITVKNRVYDNAYHIGGFRRRPRRGQMQFLHLFHARRGRSSSNRRLLVPTEQRRNVSANTQTDIFHVGRR